VIGDESSSVKSLPTTYDTVRYGIYVPSKADDVASII